MDGQDAIRTLGPQIKSLSRDLNSFLNRLSNVENSVQIKEAGMNYAASGNNPYLQLTNNNSVFYCQAYLGDMYIGPTYTKAVGIDVNGNIFQLGAYNGKTILRKIFDVVKEYPANTDVLIGTIGEEIDTVLDIKQVIYWDNKAWDLWFSDSTHNYLGIRVNLDSGNVYAHSCVSNWSTPSRLIVYVDYTLK